MSSTSSNPASSFSSSLASGISLPSLPPLRDLREELGNDSGTASAQLTTRPNSSVSQQQEQQELAESGEDPALDYLPTYDEWQQQIHAAEPPPLAEDYIPPPPIRWEVGLPADPPATASSLVHNYAQRVWNSAAQRRFVGQLSWQLFFAKLRRRTAELIARGAEEIKKRNLRRIAAEEVKPVYYRARQILTRLPNCSRFNGISVAARWAVLRISEDRTVERGLLLRLREREASGVQFETKLTQIFEDAYVFDPAPPPGYTSSNSSSDSRFGGSLP